uniref:Uncharacterized protein n=1 Tax=Opuntia streptacantha TaxID=393608 RepID=A0A7C8ZLR8_OPUST
MGKASSSLSCAEDLSQWELSFIGHFKAHEDSSSVSFMAGDWAISFGLGPHVICEPQARPFTCKSSFTAFLVEPSTPMLMPGGFSFCGNGRSSSPELASVISSMPSFTFCRPSPGPQEVRHRASFLDSMASTSATYTCLN